MFFNNMLALWFKLGQITQPCLDIQQKLADSPKTWVWTGGKYVVKSQLERNSGYLNIHVFSSILAECCVFRQANACLRIAFAWSKMMKNIAKLWKKYLFHHVHERLMWDAYNSRVTSPGGQIGKASNYVSELALPQVSHQWPKTRLAF